MTEGPLVDGINRERVVAIGDMSFRDPDRPEADNAGAALIVYDGFYPDPYAVRQMALAQEFVSYSPPAADRLSADMSEQIGRRPGNWLSSAFVTYLGQQIAKPFPGMRHNPPEVRAGMSRLLDEVVDDQSWETGGDYWNGAFHLIDADWRSEHGLIHHHYKPGDVETRGWSGLVYLSPDPDPAAGTSIWRDRTTGRCISPYGGRFEIGSDRFDLAYLIENRFNRLVLFRENVLHKVECGFGRGLDARLTQTFFFSSVALVQARGNHRNPYRGRAGTELGRGARI